MKGNGNKSKLSEENEPDLAHFVEVKYNAAALGKEQNWVKIKSDA